MPKFLVGFAARLLKDLKVLLVFRPKQVVSAYPLSDLSLRSSRSPPHPSPGRSMIHVNPLNVQINFEFDFFVLPVIFIFYFLYFRLTRSLARTPTQWSPTRTQTNRGFYSLLHRDKIVITNSCFDACTVTAITLNVCGKYSF